MGTINVSATVDSSAPIEAVWATLVDTRSWPIWAPQDEAWLDADGTDDPEGVGAIRRFRTGRYMVREEVVVFAPPHDFGYRLLSGLPLRDYVARVRLDEHDGGTRVSWQATFRPAYPGTGPVARRRMRKLLETIAGALARHAAAGSTDASGPSQ